MKKLQEYFRTHKLARFMLAFCLLLIVVATPALLIFPYVPDTFSVAAISLWSPGFELLLSVAVWFVFGCLALLLVSIMARLVLDRARPKLSPKTRIRVASWLARTLPRLGRVGRIVSAPFDLWYRVQGWLDRSLDIDWRPALYMIFLAICTYPLALVAGPRAAAVMLATVILTGILLVMQSLFCGLSLDVGSYGFVMLTFGLLVMLISEMVLVDGAHSVQRIIDRGLFLPAAGGLLGGMILLVLLAVILERGPDYRRWDTRRVIDKVSDETGLDHRRVAEVMASIYRHSGEMGDLEELLLDIESDELNVGQALARELKLWQERAVQTR